MPSKDQSCTSCNAFLPNVGAGMGACRANPPQVVLLGVSEPPSIAIGGRHVGGVAQPITQTFFPQMQAHGWCRQWQPRLEAVQ